MEIIPAIDIIDGKCVRLTKGDYSTKKVYGEDPLEMAKRFAGAGLRRLHLVDLDGAKAGLVQNWKVLEKIAAHTKLVIDFSGGISNEQLLSQAFNLGAAYVGLGSMAVTNRETILKWALTYGPWRFMLSADVKDNSVLVNGWTEKAAIDIFQFVGEYTTHGLCSICCTDISKDGMLQGPASSLYKCILERYPGTSLIASGGVSELKDISTLAGIGCSGVIIGKAIYEGRIDLKDLSRYVN